MELLVTPHNHRLAEFLGVAKTSEAEPAVLNVWAPLQALVSPDALRKFMYMGQQRQGELVVSCFKHVDTRRYLNIDPIDLTTYRWISAQNLYVEIPRAEALETVYR